MDRIEQMRAELAVADELAGVLKKLPDDDSRRRVLRMLLEQVPSKKRGEAQS